MLTDRDRDQIREARETLKDIKTERGLLRTEREQLEKLRRELDTMRGEIIQLLDVDTSQLVGQALVAAVAGTEAAFREIAAGLVDEVAEIAAARILKGLPAQPRKSIHLTSTLGTLFVTPPPPPAARKPS